MAKESALSRPARMPHPFKRAAILFAGGPAPAANAVISAAAVSFLRDDIKVVGVKHGYQQLLQYAPAARSKRAKIMSCSAIPNCGALATRRAS